MLSSERCVELPFETKKRAPPNKAFYPTPPWSGSGRRSSIVFARVVQGRRTFTAAPPFMSGRRHFRHDERPVESHPPTGWVSSDRI